MSVGAAPAAGDEVVDLEAVAERRSRGLRQCPSRASTERMIFVATARSTGGRSRAGRRARRRGRARWWSWRGAVRASRQGSGRRRWWPGHAAGRGPAGSASARASGVCSGRRRSASARGSSAQLDRARRRRGGRGCPRCSPFAGRSLSIELVDGRFELGAHQVGQLAAEAQHRCASSFHFIHNDACLAAAPATPRRSACACVRARRRRSTGEQFGARSAHSASVVSSASCDHRRELLVREPTLRGRRRDRGQATPTPGPSRPCRARPAPTRPTRRRRTRIERAALVEDRHDRELLGPRPGAARTPARRAAPAATRSPGPATRRLDPGTSIVTRPSNQGGMTLIRPITTDFRRIFEKVTEIGAHVVPWRLRPGSLRPTRSTRQAGVMVDGLPDAVGPAIDTYLQQIDACRARPRRRAVRRRVRGARRPSHRDQRHRSCRRLQGGPLERALGARRTQSTALSVPGSTSCTQRGATSDGTHWICRLPGFAAGTFQHAMEHSTRTRSCGASLATKGIAFRGSAARAGRRLVRCLDVLREWNLANLDSYWADWVTWARGQDGTEARVRFEYGLQWLVLGVPRLHCTIATLEVISKTAAGHYAKQVVPSEWHAVLDAAIALRADRRAQLDARARRVVARRHRAGGAVDRGRAPRRRCGLSGRPRPRRRHGSRAGRVVPRVVPRAGDGARPRRLGAQPAPTARVEAVFEGPEAAVDRAVDWCRTGPAHARVDAVDVHRETPIGEVTFNVR